MNYGERAAAHEADRDVERRRSHTISTLRLTTFLTGAACIVWWLTWRAGLPLVGILGGALLAVFAVLVVWHARVEARAAWFEALRIVNVRAQARVDREWSALPLAEPPPSFDAARHPYAQDLDLFGRASLAQWLGPPATPYGSVSLSQWLLAPADPGEVAARQEAVAELAPAAQWRERFAAHGVLLSAERPVNLERFLAWAEGDGTFGNAAAWRIGIRALTLSIWVLLGLQIAGLLQSALWLVSATAGIVVSFVAARRLHETFSGAGAGDRALAIYAGLFEDAVGAPAASARLRQVHDRLSAGGHSAPECMRQLRRILGFADLRTGAGVFHFLIHALTLWDFHVAFAFDRWRQRVGPRARDWMTALGELDALSSFASVAFDNPDWCTPRIDAAPELIATGIGHPLISGKRRVTNDVEIGPAGTVLLITGSNMSGKSTLLRAVGLNVVLAQAGGRACAAALRLPAADLQASMRVQDSLELGLSYFMAALARLKGIVDRAEQPRPGRTLLYLLDEILQGTNTAERSIAVRGIIRHLLEAGAIGAMTTHDLALAAEPPLDRAARLVHFTESMEADGRMSFDYRLRPGLATSRNALRLMQLIGIELRPEDRSGH